MKIFLDECGQGEPVVLLHGTPTSVDVFAPLAAVLARRYRVIVPHFPGYGRSPAVEGAAWRDTLQLVETALQVAGIGSAAFVGFSSGAWRAFQVALFGTVHVHALVSIGGLVGLTPAEQGVQRQFAAGLRAGVDFTEAAARRFFAPAFRRDDALRIAKQWMTATSPQHLANELETVSAEPDLQGELRGVEVPVLARVGELDAATPPVKSRAIAAAVKHGTLEIVAGAGHALLVEDAAATVASVDAFLRANL